MNGIARVVVIVMWMVLAGFAIPYAQGETVWVLIMSGIPVMAFLSVTPNTGD